MGKLIDGVWHDQWYDTSRTGGRFVREDSRFHGRVTAEPGPFPAMPARYRLYVSLACPWAHRVLIARRLKGLEDVIPVAVVHPYMGSQGWSFDADFPGATGDPLHGLDYLHQLYTRADPHYTGRVTVPLLWDERSGTIVNNESAELMRMLNRAFDAWGDASVDLCPPALEREIDQLNAWVYEKVNNGVYRAGFATTQAAYEEAVSALFAALDELERRLTGRDYLVGDRLTEADIRLFTTLVRFEPVYQYHFKCNLRRLTDYPALLAHTRRLYHLPGVAATVSFDHIKAHYFRSHPTINPTGVVPVGPSLDFLNTTPSP